LGQRANHKKIEVGGDVCIDGDDGEKMKKLLALHEDGAFVIRPDHHARSSCVVSGTNECGVADRHHFRAS
jgi:hypothetical protein